MILGLLRLDYLQPLSIVELKLFPLDSLRPLLVDLSDDVEGRITDFLDLRVLIVHQVNQVRHGLRFLYEEIPRLVVTAEDVEQVNDLDIKFALKK